MIDKNITIEDLIEDYPKSVKYLADKGIRCIKCGEPIWGTLEEACVEKGFTQEAISQVVIDLNALHNQKETDDQTEQVVHIKKIK